MSFKAGGWIFVFIGTLFLLIGLGIVWVGFSTRSQVNNLGSQPLWKLSDLQTGSVGASGVFEGQVSENNPLLFRGFVAYWQELYEGEDCSRDSDGDTDCTSIWTLQARQIPPISLDLPAGRVKIINADYAILYPTTWQNQAHLVEFVTKRTSGLEVGHPVFVKATLGSAGETPTLQAEFVAGLNRADYLAAERVSALGFLIFGGIFALVGGGLLFGWILSHRL